MIAAAFKVEWRTPILTSSSAMYRPDGSSMKNLVLGHSCFPLNVENERTVTGVAVTPLMRFAITVKLAHAQQ